MWICGHFSLNLHSPFYLFTLLPPLSLSVLFPLTHSFSCYPFMSFVPSLIWFYTIRPPPPHPSLPHAVPVFLPLPIHHSCSSLCWLLPPLLVIVYWPYGRQCSHWPCAAECFALVMHTWLSDIVAPQLLCLPFFLSFFPFLSLQFLCVLMHHLWFAGFAPVFSLHEGLQCVKNAAFLMLNRTVEFYTVYFQILVWHCL